MGTDQAGKKETRQGKTLFTVFCEIINTECRGIRFGIPKYKTDECMKIQSVIRKTGYSVYKRSE
ncbi:MAG: hypothetical protein V2I97_18880 [Desulfococcaceae bacterium]|jgi:hypothetical protein|nr:hypothetical protein [Desulfococcaceae bacterium]